MTRSPSSPTRQRAICGALIALAATDTAVSTLYSQTYFPGPAMPILTSLLLAGLGLIALPFGSRAPYAVFALTVAGAAVSTAIIASQMGLYAVAKQRSSLRWLIICAVTAFVVYTASWAKPYSVLSTIWSALYSATFVIAPIGLGLLMRARVEISSKLAEIERVRRHEQQLLIERALARQRAELAREMHDVVSHQVSLIAVQAGALQVTARDDAAAHTARTIRALSVQTLDELRHMVGVLRTAAGDRTDQPQQPGLDNIDTLVATSGVPAVISARLDNDIIPSPAVQHVLYRTVQEGLTNITKHAPGATATLEFHIDFDQVSLKLTNSKPDRSPDRLPGARYGLLGLRERAAQLGGTLRAGPLDDGGFELSLTLPTHI